MWLGQRCWQGFFDSELAAARPALRMTICLGAATVIRVRYYRSVMMHRCVRFLPAILFVLALSGCYSGTRPPRIGTVAPDFTVQDSQTSITLSKLRGQIVVLNF